MTNANRPSAGWFWTKPEIDPSLELSRALLTVPVDVVGSPTTLQPSPAVEFRSLVPKPATFSTTFSHSGWTP